MIARIRKSLDEKEKGFTLIELLVVVIIIGILSAIAIPIFLNQSRKAVDKAAQADVSALAKQVATYFIDNDGPLTISGDATTKSYTISDGATGADDIVVAKSDEGFVASIAPTDGTQGPDTFTVTITYDGGSAGDGAQVSYDAETGVTAPTPAP